MKLFVIFMLTWLIFAGPVTYIDEIITDNHVILNNNCNVEILISPSLIYVYTQTYHSVHINFLLHMCAYCRFLEYWVDDMIVLPEYRGKCMSPVTAVSLLFLPLLIVAAIW